MEVSVSWNCRFSRLWSSINLRFVLCTIWLIIVVQKLELEELEATASSLFSASILMILATCIHVSVLLSNSAVILFVSTIKSGSSNDSNINILFSATFRHHCCWSNESNWRSISGAGTILQVHHVLSFSEKKKSWSVADEQEIEEMMKSYMLTRMRVKIQKQLEFILPQKAKQSPMHPSLPRTSATSITTPYILHLTFEYIVHHSTSNPPGKTSPWLFDRITNCSLVSGYPAAIFEGYLGGRDIIHQTEKQRDICTPPNILFLNSIFHPPTHQ